MAIRIVCDVCGKNAPETKFIVPVYNRIVLHSKVSGEYNGEDETMVSDVNLCNRCRLELAHFLSIIK